MNTNEIIEKSVYIITEYYKNNTQPFFDNIDDDILWIGPAENQILRGKANILSAWSNESHSLTFTMSDITTIPIRCSATVFEIVLIYHIYTHYPNGKSTVHKQCLHYTWAEKCKINKDNTYIREPKLTMIHISNAFPYDDRDSIYPNHYIDLDSAAFFRTKEENNLTFSGQQHIVYFIGKDKIIYIESINRARHSIIHLTGDTDFTNALVESTDSLNTIEDKYKDYFFRIHTGYMINPLYLSKIERCKVILTDGTELPIPKRKYTEIKRSLLSISS